MPAIDLERLTRDVTAVGDAFAEPGLLRRRCVDLLTFYADRTRRPTSSDMAVEKASALGTPNPVLDALGRELIARAQAQPGLALPAADALWEAGYRETCIVAASLLGALQSVEVLDWIEGRARLCRDFPSLQALAEKGLRGWRSSQAKTLVSRCEAWLGDRAKRVRALGLLSLAALAEEASFEKIPMLLRLINGQLGAARDEVARALQVLLRALARRSPAEAAHYLLEELQSGGKNARRVARRVLDAFPERQRESLREALSE
jgi:hypothetical protein